MRARLESALGVLPFFAPLRADERVRIAERFRVRRLEPGETYAIAPEAPELVLVLDGQATLTVACGAIAALATARTVVAMIIRNGLQKHLFALIGSQVGHPVHVHHFNYGLLLVSTVGVLVLLPRARRGLRRLAFVFGFGLGLIVDEF